MADLADLGDGLQDADLIVRGHDRDENRLIVDGTLQVFEINKPIGLHRQIGDAVAVLLEALAGVEDSLVLGDLRDDVIAALAIHLGNALDGEVVRLGCTRGEDDLFGGGADEFRDLLAGRFNRLLSLPAKGVIAAGMLPNFAVK